VSRPSWLIYRAPITPRAGARRHRRLRRLPFSAHHGEPRKLEVETRRMAHAEQLGFGLSPPGREEPRSSSLALRRPRLETRTPCRTARPPPSAQEGPSVSIARPSGTSAGSGSSKVSRRLADVAQGPRTHQYVPGRSGASSEGQKFMASSAPSTSASSRARPRNGVVPADKKE
jgi:hypothetical protein